MVNAAITETLLDLFGEQSTYHGLENDRTLTCRFKKFLNFNLERLFQEKHFLNVCNLQKPQKLRTAVGFTEI